MDGEFKAPANIVIACSTVGKVLGIGVEVVELESGVCTTTSSLRRLTTDGGSEGI